MSANLRTRNPPRWVLFTLLVIGLLVNLFCGTSTVRAEGLIDNKKHRIEEALFYAQVYNVPQVLKITGSLAGACHTPKDKAWVAWLEAAAFGQFMLEYRTNAWRYEYERAVERVKKYNPSLYERSLLRLDVYLDYYVYTKVPDNETSLCEFVRKYRPDSWEAILAGDTTDTSRLARIKLDPSAAYALGIAGALAMDASMTSTALRSNPLINSSPLLLRYAYETKPDYFEYAFDATVTAPNGGDCSLLHQVLPHFRNRPPSEPTRMVFSLAFLEVEVAVCRETSSSQAEKRIDLLKERFATHKDPLIGLEYARHLRATTSTMGKKRNLLQEVMRVAGEKKENGDMLSGYVFVSAMYNYVDNVLIPSLEYEEAVAMIGRIQALSPHYAVVHYLKAYCFSQMAVNVENDVIKKQFLKQAVRELQEQSEYNWHGTIQRDVDVLMDHINSYRFNLTELP